MYNDEEYREATKQVDSMELNEAREAEKDIHPIDKSKSVMDEAWTDEEWATFFRGY